MPKSTSSINCTIQTVRWIQESIVLGQSISSAHSPAIRTYPFSLVNIPAMHTPAGHFGFESYHVPVPNNTVSPAEMVLFTLFTLAQAVDQDVPSFESLPDLEMWYLVPLKAFAVNNISDIASKEILYIIVSPRVLFLLVFYPLHRQYNVKNAPA